MSELEKVAEIYDRFTSLSAWDGNLHFGYWDDPASTTSIEEAAHRLTDLMAGRLALEPGAHILDVGCGVGGPAMRVASKYGVEVTGVSISSRQVARANELAAEAGLSDQVRFLVADAMSMDLPEDNFDGAIAIESIMNMPDRRAVLSRIGRSLRSGKRLVLTDAFARGPIVESYLPAVRRFFNGFSCSMVEVEKYPELLRSSGMWFEEILDITEHTMKRSWSILSRRFAEMRPRLQELYGSEMAPNFDTTDLLEIDELGYLMVVAKRGAGQR